MVILSFFGMSLVRKNAEITFQFHLQYRGLNQLQWSPTSADQKYKTKHIWTTPSYLWGRKLLPSVSTTGFTYHSWCNCTKTILVLQTPHKRKNTCTDNWRAKSVQFRMHYFTDGLDAKTSLTISGNTQNWIRLQSWRGSSLSWARFKIT